MLIKKICVLGLGYIGLPTASLLANNGFDVVGVEKKDTLVEVINKGGVHIEEPGLKTIVHAAVKSGFLQARSAPEKADAFFIAVPTPVKKLNGDVCVDLDYVRQATEEVGACLREGNLVILESTSPPGTTRDVVVPLLEEKSGLKAGDDFSVAYCPERVMPGKTLHELIHNNRVIGGITPESAQMAAALYGKFVDGEISQTDATTAEMVKLMENIYRDVNIALANELAVICEKAGVSAWEAIELASLHPRVNLHQPGPGVGGHCISVDPWFIIDYFREDARLISAARDINDRRPERVLQMLDECLEKVKESARDAAGAPVKDVAGSAGEPAREPVNNPVVTVLGVAYKGNIDDVRESPALKVIAGLEERGITFKVYDPHVSDFKYDTRGLREAFEGSDCAVILTDHDEFSFLYPKELGALMRSKIVIDTRNCLNRQLWEENGFTYQLLGSGN